MLDTQPRHPVTNGMMSHFTFHSLADSSTDKSLYFSIFSLFHRNIADIYLFIYHYWAGGGCRYAQGGDQRPEEITHTKRDTTI